MVKSFIAKGGNLERARIAPGMLMQFLARKEDTNGEFALIEATAKRGMEPGPHTHTKEDESFYIINGRMWFRIGADEFEAGPGDFVFMPRGIEHQMKFLTETIHVLLIISPAGYDEYFWMLSMPAESLEIPEMPMSPPTPEMLGMMAELNDHYGLILGER